MFELCLNASIKRMRIMYKIVLKQFLVYCLFCSSRYRRPKRDGRARTRHSRGSTASEKGDINMMCEYADHQCQDADGVAHASESILLNSPVTEEIGSFN